MGLGENHLIQPKELIDKMIEYSHKKHYTSANGISNLNKALKKIYNDNNFPQHILLGNGLKELIFVVQLAFKGDIFHITPSWVSYEEQINILGKRNNLFK